MAKRKTVPAPTSHVPPAPDPDESIYLAMADAEDTLADQAAELTGVQEPPLEPPPDEIPLAAGQANDLPPVEAAPADDTPADDFPAGGNAALADDAMLTITVPESFLQVARARKRIQIQTSKSMTAMWIKAGALELPYSKLTPRQVDSLKSAAIAAFEPLFYVQGVNGNTTTLVCQ